MRLTLALVLCICILSPAWAGPRVPFCGAELEVMDRWVQRPGLIDDAVAAGSRATMLRRVVAQPHDDVLAVIRADGPVRVPAGTVVKFYYADGDSIPTREILYPWDLAETGYSSSVDGFTTGEPRTARKKGGGWTVVLRFPFGSLPRDWKPERVRVVEGGD